MKICTPPTCYLVSEDKFQWSSPEEEIELVN